MADKMPNEKNSTVISLSTERASIRATARITNVN